MTDIHELDQYLQNLEREDKFSGVVRLTRADSELFAGAYGFASRAWRISNSLDTGFDTASMTKLFTAISVLQLIDSGLLTFETSAIDILGLENTAISRDVNVRHLLTHTSGIGDDADEEAGESYEDLWIDKPNYGVTATSDFLPQFIHKPPNFPPGNGCRYNNCGYILLGLIIEKITGTTYRDYVREQVFRRAGMENSGFFRMDRVQENVAEGCDPIRDDGDRVTGWKRNIYSFPPVGSPDAGAHVTAGDLNRFLYAVREGRLLSPELTEAFLTPQVHYRDRGDGTQKFGYGLWFALDRSENVVFFQKEGINAGVSGLIRHYLQRDITVVMLSNMEGGVWEPIGKVDEIIAGSGFDGS